MKYQIICTETKLSPVVQKNIIDKLEKVEKTFEKGIDKLR